MEVETSRYIMLFTSAFTGKYEKEMRQYNTEKNTDEVMWLVSAVVKTYTCYKFNSVRPKILDTLKEDSSQLSHAYDCLLGTPTTIVPRTR